MDALVLERLADEWRSTLQGCVFRGIQTEPTGARLYFGPPKGSQGSVYVLTARWPEPLWLHLEETMLPRERSRLEATQRFDGEPIVSITVPPRDRRIRFDLGGEKRARVFVEVEAWPPGNVIVVHPHRGIVWIARRRQASSVRKELAPGLAYADPPPPFRKDPREATVAELEEKLTESLWSDHDEKRLADELNRHWSGLGGPIGRDMAALLYRSAGSGSKIDREVFAKTLRETSAAAYAPEGAVLGLRWEDKHRSASLIRSSFALSPREELHLEGPWPTWSTAARNVVQTFPAAISSEEIAEARKRVRRVERSLRSAKTDLQRAGEGDKQRAMGEALLASLHLVKRGASRVEVPDPSNPDKTFRLELDPKLPGHVNANRFFKRAKKHERALQTIPARIHVLEGEFKKATDLLEALERGERPEGYVPPKFQGSLTPGKPARHQVGPSAREGDQVPAKLLPRKYRTREGWEVWIGKSNEGNDYLTHRLAKGQDYWFHVQGSPGSHVVLRRGTAKDEPSRDTLREVAAWTAFYSRQKTSGTVPVIYTRKKYVRKPRGAKAGLAQVEREKQIFIRPQEPPRENLIDTSAEPTT